MILVVVALEEELPGQLPSGYKKLVTGVGKVNASIALTTELAYNDHAYERIINYGSAGGTEALKGQLVGISAVIERDMDCTPLGLPLYVSPDDEEQMISASGIVSLTANDVIDIRCTNTATGDFTIVGWSLSVHKLNDNT